MSSVASMMSLTSTVSGGGLTEAAPGGVLMTSTTTYTLEVSASVAVPVWTGSVLLIPYSSNYCFAALAAGSVGETRANGDGGQGGSLGYINGITLAVGDQITMTCSGVAPAYYGQYTYNTISWPGGSFSVSQRFGPQTQYSGAGSNRYYQIGGGGGSGSGTHWSNYNNPGGGGGGAASWAVGTTLPRGQNGPGTQGQGGQGLDPYGGAANTSSNANGAQYGGGGGGGGGNGAYGFCRVMYGLNRSFPSTNIGNGSSYTGGHADASL